MFGPRGNPQASNLFAVLGHLQQQTGVRLKTWPWNETPPHLPTPPPSGTVKEQPR